jgi:hypothetical protein
MAAGALLAGTFVVNNLLYASDRQRFMKAANDRKHFAEYVKSGGLWKRAGGRPVSEVQSQEVIII